MCEFVLGANKRDAQRVAVAFVGQGLQADRYLTRQTGHGFSGQQSSSWWSGVPLGENGEGACGIATWLAVPKLLVDMAAAGDCRTDREFRRNSRSGVQRDQRPAVRCSGTLSSPWMAARIVP